MSWQKRALAVPEDQFLFMLGGRGGGKTHGLAYIILRDAMKYGPYFLAALVRRDLDGLKKLERELIKMIDLMAPLRGSRYLTGQKVLKFASGGLLFLHYLKDEKAFGRFQGEDLSHLYIDEVAQIPEPAPVLRMTSSLRTTHPTLVPRLVCTANPGNIGSWWIAENLVFKLQAWEPAYVDLFKRKCVIAHSTLFDNPYIDQEEYERTLRASCHNDPARIASEVHGDWTAVSGSFFGAVLSENRSLLPAVTVPIREYIGPYFNPRYLWMSLDWGSRVPSSVQLAYQTPIQTTLPNGRVVGRGSFIVFDELYTCRHKPDGTPDWNIGNTEMTTSKIANGIIRLCTENGITFSDIPRSHRVADAAVGAVIGGDDGSIGKQLKDFGTEFVAAPKGLRAPGWVYMKTLMEQAGDPSLPGLYVTSKCASFWISAPQAQYREKDPNDLDLAVDHTLDSLRYMLVSSRSPKHRGNNATATAYAIY